MEELEINPLGIVPLKSLVYQYLLIQVELQIGQSIPCIDHVVKRDLRIAWPDVRNDMEVNITKEIPVIVVKLSDNDCMANLYHIIKLFS